MDFVSYEDLKTKIIPDLKRKNKKIARLSVSGGVHDGHLSGVKFALTLADVSVVLLGRWFNPGLMSLIGSLSTRDFFFRDYKPLLNKDIDVLRKSGVVDYVAEVPYTEDIHTGLVRVYMTLQKNKDEIFNTKGFQLFTKADQKRFLARTAVHWYTPDKELWDITPYGAKDIEKFLLCEKYMRKEGDGILGKPAVIFPVSRLEDGTPVSSTEMFFQDEEGVRKRREKEREISIQVQNLVQDLYRSGKIPEDVETYSLSKFSRICLIEKESFDFVTRLQSGKKFFLSLNVPYLIDEFLFFYLDCFEVEG